MEAQARSYDGVIPVGWAAEWRRENPDALWALTVRCEACDAADPGITAPALAVMWLEGGRWYAAIPHRGRGLVSQGAMPGQRRPYFTRTTFSDFGVDEGPGKGPMPLRCRRCRRIPGKKRRDLWAAAGRQAALGLDFLYV